MTGPQWITLVALVVLYILLLGDWFHRAWVALGLAGALVLSGTISPESAWSSIDWNTIFLLAGMMVLVASLGEAGLFSYLGDKARRWSMGQPWRLLWIFYVVTAITSAFLDNVTTVLLLSPILIAAAEELEINPVPLLMVEVVASNLGGMATLVGDPPNILIGTAGDLSFTEFLRILGPAALIMLVLLAVVLPRFIKLPTRARRPLAITSTPVKVKPELKGLLVILAATLSGFVLQEPLHIPVGYIALGGGALAVLFRRKFLSGWHRHIDYGTLGFFVGVFILVGALESAGFIQVMVGWLNDPRLGAWMPLILFFGTVIFSAGFDNVPLVAALVPVLSHIVSKDPGFGVELWLAVAMGASVGGNATIIGASANVVVQGLALESGYRMSFGDYARFGFKVAGFTSLVAAAYLTLRFSGVGPG